MNDSVLFGVASVGTIVGLVQVAIQSGLPERYGPLASVVLGVFGGLAQLSSISEPWPQAVATGLSLGLAATGLHHTATQVWPVDRYPTSEPQIPYLQTSAPIRHQRPLRNHATENNSPTTSPSPEVELNPFIEDR